MKIAVASGKGGTGKTTIAVNLTYTLALSGKRVTLLDCDVEEPNDHLFVHPEIIETHPVQILKPVLETKKCNGCGKCVMACKEPAGLSSLVLEVRYNLCVDCNRCAIAIACPDDALVREAREKTDETTGQHGTL